MIEDWVRKNCNFCAMSAFRMEKEKIGDDNIDPPIDMKVLLKSSDEHVKTKAK